MLVVCSGEVDDMFSFLSGFAFVRRGNVLSR